MKTFTLILFLISSLSIIGKSNQIPGDYLYKSGNAKHNIEYKLQLFKDGTFTFHSLTNIQNPPQKNYLFGKGTWTIEAKVITFHTNKENDITEKHTLDFNDTKARFITKSPRDKSDKIVPTSLQFFKSKIFWIERLKINKS